MSKASRSRDLRAVKNLIIQARALLSDPGVCLDTAARSSELLGTALSLTDHLIAHSVAAENRGNAQPVAAQTGAVPLHPPAAR